MRFVSICGERSPIFEALNARAAEYARERGFAYLWAPLKPYDRERAVELLRGGDAGLIDTEPYDASVFSRIAPRCRLLVRFGVGYDRVNLADATESGIAIARPAGANATGVAEMALMQMLAAKRRLMVHRRTVEGGVWSKNIGSELIGATVGIVGFGAIGQQLARLLRGFECHILAYDPFADAARMAELGATACGIEELAERSDAISIHAPYGPQTHHLFGAALLARMKPTAVLVCTARGNIVDEDALYDALTRGTIAAAGLDVYAEEPLPAASKLIGLDNIILTPHVASQTEQSLWLTYRRAIDIAADFFAGRPLSPADLLNPDYARSARP